MSLSCGLVGLPNVGKSTIFNALTSAGARTANYLFTTIEPKQGFCVVPDPRLARLAKLSGQTKVVPATVEFVDIAGLVKGASQGEGLGNQFLGHIRGVTVVIHVLRCFDDPDVAHVTQEINPKKDFELVQTELALADLEILERRLSRILKPAQSGGKQARIATTAYQHFMDQLQRGWAPSAEPGQEALLAELGLLTAKAQIFVANVNEAELNNRTYLPTIEAMAQESKTSVVIICGDLEAEMVELEPDERAEFLASLGWAESGLDRLVREAYRVLGLITFYTIVGAELRAWSAPQDSTALQGAAQIHTDMARGFIAAEVIGYEDFITAGSSAAAREAGAVRIEGKDYKLADGDVVTFRFNV